MIFARFIQKPKVQASNTPLKLYLIYKFNDLMEIHCSMMCNLNWELETETS
jgi:hypothetical protein